jgi:hypothetical protein
MASRYPGRRALYNLSAFHLAWLQEASLGLPWPCHLTTRHTISFGNHLEAPGLHFGAAEINSDGAPVCLPYTVSSTAGANIVAATNNISPHMQWTSRANSNPWPDTKLGQYQDPKLTSRTFTHYLGQREGSSAVKHNQKPKGSVLVLRSSITGSRSTRLLSRSHLSPSSTSIARTHV